MVLVYLLLMFVVSLVLVWSTRLVTGSFERLANFLGIGRMAMAAIFVALSTSLPELFVGVAAALEGRPQISLGNVLGSNLVNISLVVGLATLLAGSLAVVGDYFKWEFGVAFLMGMAPVILLLDGSLSRLDGLILLVIYLVYVRDLILSGRHQALAKHGVVQPSLLTRLEKIHSNHTDRTLGEFVVGIGLLLAGADILVRLTSGLAVAVGAPILLVSLILVAFGTSVPELALEIEAVREKKVALALGNILGSTVANSTLIVGLTAIISPFRVAAVRSYGLASIGFVILFGLFWLFSNSARKLSRGEGLILIGIYLVFVGLMLFNP